MSSAFKTSKLYKILSVEERSVDVLKELNRELSAADVAVLSLEDSEIGTYLHYLTQTAQATDDVSWRMVYSLSNAGINVNKRNSKGNTALHSACMKGYVDIGFNFIEALFKVGIDPTIKNNHGNYASYYMEDIEQLNVIYKTHYPGIIAAVEKHSTKEVKQLLEAWVKVDVCANNNMNLLVYAQTYFSTNSELIQLLTEYKECNNFVHFLLALDVEQLRRSAPSLVNPNMADSSYVYTWYRPINRNLPKYLFECALDTNSIEIVELLLDSGCDVNLPSTNNADPFYFNAFAKREFFGIKEKFLAKADYRGKNQKGYNLLFHLVYSYLKMLDAGDNGDVVINDFQKIMSLHPWLLYQRDQDGITLVETIKLLAPNQYKVAKRFIQLINSFIFKVIFEARDFNLFLEFIYNGYGLILVNTKFHFNEEQPVIVEKYIEENNIVEFKKILRFYFNSKFIEDLNEFYKCIKSGDLDRLKRLLLAAHSGETLILFADYGGRSCLHIAVLYSHLGILRFLLELNPKLLNSRDNLNRTVLHYAYGVCDKKIVEFLLSYGIDSQLRDAKFLLAEDYLSDEILNDDLFRVKNFKANETSANYGLASYLKCYEYPKMHKAITSHSKRELVFIKENLSIYGMKLSDMPMLNSSAVVEWVNGEQYVPLLILAIESHSFGIFQYLLDDLIETEQLKAFEITTSERVKTSKIRQKSARTQQQLVLRNQLIQLREYAEQNETYEVIDILDNLGEDAEIKAALSDEQNRQQRARKQIAAVKNIQQQQLKLLQQPEPVSSNRRHSVFKKISPNQAPATKARNETIAAAANTPSKFDISQACAII